MLRKTVLTAVTMSLACVTYAVGQQPNHYSVLAPKQNNIHPAAYQQSMDQVLGNPFGDEQQAPAPVVQSAPGHGSVTLANCTADAPSCGAPACGLPSCDASSCCDSGCDSACGSCSMFGCDLGDAWTLSGALHGDCPPSIEVGGWISAGYHSADNGMFNNRPDNVAVHQTWLYAEKAADACNSPIGFRFDIMYGIDAGDTQAFGNSPGEWDYQNGFDHGAYGWALPQAYLELAVGDWSIKAGHFYTLIGYEVVTAPDNFFYSHAMTMYFSEPFTHTGVLASRDVGDSTVYAGWTAGWDTGFDQVNNGSSWLGGFSTPLGDDITMTYISTAGNFGARGDSAYSHSILFDTTVTENLNWVLQSDLVRVASTGEDNVGINQYFLYSVNDCLGLGARLEWWKGDVITGYAPHGGTVPAAGSYSNYAATFGANIRPHANLMLRPELRVDWSPAADYDESYFGVDAVLTF